MRGAQKRGGWELPRPLVQRPYVGNVLNFGLPRVVHRCSAGRESRVAQAQHARAQCRSQDPIGLRGWTQLGLIVSDMGAFLASENVR